MEITFLICIIAAGIGLHMTVLGRIASALEQISIEAGHYGMVVGELCAMLKKEPRLTQWDEAWIRDIADAEALLRRKQRALQEKELLQQRERELVRERDLENLLRVTKERKQSDE